jgi:sugar phosphate isomerase/epimerase
MTVTGQLSIQLYTLRLMNDLDRILDTVAAAGYRHVETIGGHLDDAANVRAKLDARGLSVSSSHVGLAALRERPEAIVAACRTLGFDRLYMPAVPPEQRQVDAAGWRAIGRELGQLAERFQKDGIQLGYHNHHWEMQPKEGGETALELLFEAAAGSPLSWEADVAWLVRGGVDPKLWMRRYSHLLTAAHVKDIAPPGQNEDEDGWADVGSGVLDWHDLWKATRAAGATWMVVEHDKPRDPARTVKASFDYLQGIEG